MNKTEQTKNLSFRTKWRIYQRVKKDENSLSIEEAQQAIESLTADQLTKCIKSLSSWIRIQKFQPLFAVENSDKFMALLEAGILENSSFIAAAIEYANQEQFAEIITRLGLNPSGSTYTYECMIGRCEVQTFSSVLQNLCVEKSHMPYSMLSFLYLHNRQDLIKSYITFTKVLSFSKGVEFFIVNTSGCFPEIASVYLKKMAIGDAAGLFFAQNLSDPEDIDCYFDKRNSLTSTEICAWLKSTPYAKMKLVQALEKLQLSLSEEEELLLITRGTPDAISFYLSHNSLHEYPATVLLRSGNKQLIMQYVERCCEPGNGVLISDYNVMILFQSGDEEVISKLAETYGLPYALERKLMRSDDFEKIRDYVLKYTPEPMNFILLVQRLSGEQLEQLLLSPEMDMQNIASSVDTVLMRREDIPELLVAYIKKLSSASIVFDSRALVNLYANASLRNNPILLDYTAKFKTSNEFTAEVVASLFCSGDTALMQSYSSEPLCDKALDLFIEKASLEAFKTYMENYSIYGIGQRALVARASSDASLLLQYLSQYKLDDAVVGELINDCSSNLVCEYISRYPLTLENQLKLIAKGDKTLIEKYADLYAFDDIAIEQLFENSYL